MSQEKQATNSDPTESSSSDFSLELVVEKLKEEDKQVENAVDANIYDFDLDTIKDKPWLKPGADITDYFNYGFSEKSWKKYCEMQKENRSFSQDMQERDYDEERYDNRPDDRYYNRRRRDDDRYQKGNRRY
jgi:pre-mRNA 3'-end-processing factor FIP1